MLPQLRWPTPNGLPPRALWITLASVIFLLVISAPLVEFNLLFLLSKLDDLFMFILRMFEKPPPLDYLPQLFEKMLETLEMALIATVLAAIISLPIGVLAARNATPHPVIGQITRDVLSFFRALPELVWALVFVSAIGLGPLPGILAIAVVSIGFMAKFFAESIEVVEIGPIEGVRATGADKIQEILYGVIPQVLPLWISYSLYRFESNVRSATVVGMVGAGGIGVLLWESIRGFDFPATCAIMLIIIVTVTVIDALSQILRKRFI